MDAVTTPGKNAGERYLTSMTPFMQKEEESQTKASEFEAEKAAQQKTFEAEAQRRKAENARQEVKTIESSDVYKQAHQLDEDMMKQTFVPTKDNAQDMATLFSLINVLGFAIGKGGKNNSVQALSAMNGMAEGYQKGRADLYKKEKDSFEENMKALKTKSDILAKRLSEIAMNAGKDHAAADLEADAFLSEQGATFIKQYKDKYGLAAAAARAKELTGMAGKAFELTEQERQKSLDRANQVSLEKIRAGLQTQKAMLPMVQGIRGIEHLQTQLKDPEVQTGLLSKTAPWFEKLKSISDSPADEDFETAVNKNLTGTDKTTLFLKDALLESYAIERASQGGGRVTVQMMKQAGPVLDPSNYTPDTYNALLDQRRKVLYNNLQDMGYTQEQIKQKSAEHPYEPFGGQPSQAAAPASSKVMPAADKLKAYADAHFNGDVNAAQTFLKGQGYQ